eukprot:TRINITY_DN39769_c0_g1_i1.p1 TRINITY_DN39769_c0_g1~~TRINITY_DN39769_c0_g1_i1.p1  ORF type:complete len:512 (-),score=95.72 TRINITY_DN39769_c0_g1_i1:54-1589(-)
MASTQSGEWIPIVKNTFVDLADPPEACRTRRLKPSLTCGDVPVSFGHTADHLVLAPTLLTCSEAPGQDASKNAQRDESRDVSRAESSRSPEASSHDAPFAVPQEHPVYTGFLCESDLGSHASSRKRTRTDAEMVCSPMPPKKAGVASDAAQPSLSEFMIVKNTFVDILDTEARDRRRVLKPFLTDSDVPEPSRARVHDDALDSQDSAGSFAGSFPSRPDSSVAAHVRAPLQEDSAVKASANKGSLTQSRLNEPMHFQTPEKRKAPTHDGGTAAETCDKSSSSQSQLDASLAPNLSGEQEADVRFYPWVVNASKLRGSDRQIVSPPFSLDLGQQSAAFRLILVPKPSDSGKGANFSRSRGWGSVQVKCEAVLPHDAAHLVYTVWAGSGPKPRAPKGPVVHNFAENAISELPKNQGYWNFQEAVDKKSSTFTIWLEWKQTSGVSSKGDVLERMPAEEAKTAAKSDMLDIARPLKQQGNSTMMNILTSKWRSQLMAATEAAAESSSSDDSSDEE